MRYKRGYKSKNTEYRGSTRGKGMAVGGGLGGIKAGFETGNPQECDSV